MKHLINILAAMLAIACARAQDEQQLEMLAEQETLLEDDAYQQHLETLRKRPLNLNTAREEDLQQLQVLSALHIQSFLQYRQLLGSIIHVYELQAVPHWHVELIQKLLPYITVREAAGVAARLAGSLDGSSTLLLRISQNTMPLPAGALGAPQKATFRYRYNYKDLLQAGLLGEKDAGEPVFKGRQHTGFDFYSFHVFVRRPGIVQSLALGDFAVNLGQGLIHWQSMALGKGVEIAAGKRQSEALRPYTSAGEFNFHRGVGVTLRKGSMQCMAFASLRRLSANISADSNGRSVITSFLASGLHRTPAEQQDRNSVRQYAIGGNLRYNGHGWHAGLNMVGYEFSHPVRKADRPYNLFAFSGRRLINYSLDYDRTWRNLHLFGEMAVDGRMNGAVMTGLVACADPRLDVNVMVRHLSPGFQSLYANAFTESAVPSNESGLFAGFTFRPTGSVRLDAYYDVFLFPWLRFRTNAPSWGREFLVQVSWKASRKAEVAGRLRWRYREASQINWRTYIIWYPVSWLRLQQRMEAVWYQPGSATGQEQGLMVFCEAAYEHPRLPLGWSARLQLFDTDGFNSRIYAFEQGMPGVFSIPAVYNKGIRYYMNLRCGVNQGRSKRRTAWLPRINIYLRWGHTIHEMQSGTAFEQGRGSESKEYQLQVIFL